MYPLIYKYFGALHRLNLIRKKQKCEIGVLHLLNRFIKQQRCEIFVERESMNWIPGAPHRDI